MWTDGLMCAFSEPQYLFAERRQITFKRNDRDEEIFSNVQKYLQFIHSVCYSVPVT